MPTTREQSKVNWEAPDIGTNSFETINAGSLQRIADACEKMAVNHVELMGERDRLSSSYRYRGRRIASLERSNAALRGHITRLKKKLAEQEND